MPKERFLQTALITAIAASGCAVSGDEQTQEEELLGDVFDYMFIYAFSTPERSSFSVSVLEDSEDPCHGNVIDNCTVWQCRDDLSEFGSNDQPNGKPADLGSVTVNVSTTSEPVTMAYDAEAGPFSYSHTSTSVTFSGGDLLTFRAGVSETFPTGFTRHLVVPHPIRPEPALPAWGQGTIDIKKGRDFEVAWSGGENETVSASIINFQFPPGSAQIGIECVFDGWAGKGSIPASLIAFLPPTSALPEGDGGYNFFINSGTWGARKASFVRHVGGQLFISTDVKARDGDYTSSARASVTE